MEKTLGPVRESFSESFNQTFYYQAVGNGKVKIWLSDSVITESENLTNVQDNYSEHGIPSALLWQDDNLIQ